MYELLKVSGIAHDSLDGETRNKSGSSGAHGALLLRGSFSAEFKSHDLGRFGKRLGYQACCCDVLQPNWGPLVTSKESVIL